MEHKLKIKQEYFEPVIQGKKRFDDGNAIICVVAEGRTVEQIIADTVIILPKKSGTLDVFE